MEEATSSLIKIIAEYPLEPWFERKWVIAILGTITGFLLTVIVQEIKEYLKRARLKMNLTRSLFAEIALNVLNHQKKLPSLEATLSQFKVVITETSRSSHPSLIYTGLESFTQFFNLYKEHLHFFDRYLFIQLCTFYQYHLACVENSAKKVEKQFQKFYAGDKMVGSDDVIKGVEEYIANTKGAIKNANELLAELVVHNKELLERVPGMEDKFDESIKKIDDYVTALPTGTTLNIDDLMKHLSIHPVTINFALLKNKSLTHTSLGKFKKS